MRKLTIGLCLIGQLFFLNGFAQNSNRSLGSIEFIAEELTSIINKDAEIEVIAKDCQFTEGPLWLEKEQMLLFSDVPANIIYKWTENRGKEIFLKPAGYTSNEPRGGFMGPNGLFLTANNELWICQHGDRRIARMDAPLDDPKSNFLTVVGTYEDKRLNSPNDLCISSKGDIYFTDPAYGFERGPGDPKKELDFQGVYKMDNSGKLTLLIDSIQAPNGIAIFPDQKTLIVSNTQGKNRGWYRYDLTGKGLLKNGRVFYNPGDDKAMGGCDGIKIDKAGNVFATGPGGVWIFTKSGKLIGKIKVNDLVAANCALSPDEKTLYITATQYVLRVNMR